MASESAEDWSSMGVMRDFGVVSGAAVLGIFNYQGSIFKEGPIIKFHLRGE